MAGGGPSPELTNKAIKRRVLREILRHSPWRRVIRVDQLALHQEQRRLPVQHDVVERVRDDLGEPHETRLHVTQEEQVDRAEDQSAEAHPQPHQADVVDELVVVQVRVEEAEQRRIPPQQRG